MARNRAIEARKGQFKKMLREEFEALPPEKRHYFCVELYRFICVHDPEVDEMNRTAREVGNPTVHKLLTNLPEGESE